MLTNIAWMIYLADVVENVKHTLQPLIAALSGYILVLIVFKCMLALLDDDKNGLVAILNKRSTIIPIGILLFMLSIDSALPSKNTIYIAAGAVATDEVIKKISENKDVNIIKDKVITLVNKKLDEAIVDSKVEGEKK